MRNVLLTGGSAGIGLTLCRELLDRNRGDAAFGERLERGVQPVVGRESRFRDPLALHIPSGSDHTLLTVKHATMYVSVAGSAIE